MSTKKILRWAREIKADTVAEKVLLLVLASHADAAGLISPGPSWVTLCRETGLARSTLSVTLRALVARGLVERSDRRRTNGSHSSNAYQLRTDATSAAVVVRSPNHNQFAHRTTTSSLTEVRSPNHSPTSSLTEPHLTSGNEKCGSVSEPLEVKEKELKELAAARYARDAHTHAREAAPNGDRNGSSAREQLERLSATATSKDAYVLVTQWRVNHATQLPQKFYDQVTKAVQQLLNDKDLNAEPVLIRQALEKLDRRPDAGPALLPDFYTDMLRDRNDRLSKPAFDEYGYPQRPLDEITDEDLTRPVLERIIGEDHKVRYEYPPDEIENDPKLRTEWYAKHRDRRLALWRAAAREKLAKRQQRAT